MNMCLMTALNLHLIMKTMAGPCKLENFIV